MSLIAPLLSVPGRVRKLRGYNAPKLPAAGSIAPTVTKAENQSYDGFPSWGKTSLMPQAHETHFAFLKAQNNAAELIEPACDIIGSGALYGVWLLYSGYIPDGDVRNWMRVGANVIVDGVELISQSWAYESRILNEGITQVVDVVNSSSANSSIKIPLIGTLNTILPTTDYRYNREFVPLIKPIRFDSSLQINLIHQESEVFNPSNPIYADGVTARLCAAVYEDA